MKRDSAAPPYSYHSLSLSSVFTSHRVHHCTHVCCQCQCVIITTVLLRTACLACIHVCVLFVIVACLTALVSFAWHAVSVYVFYCTRSPELFRVLYSCSCTIACYGKIDEVIKIEHLAARCKLTCDVACCFLALFLYSLLVFSLSYALFDTYLHSLALRFIMQ
jgi:hypothetical protein